MSVPKGDRKEASTEFIHVARELYIYTVRKCVGFPKRYTFYMGQQMANLAGQIYEDVISANSIYPTCKADATLRRQYLQTAHAELRALVAQIEIAIELFGLRHDDVSGSEMENAVGCKVDHWMELAYREIRLVKGVLKSDARRYGNLPE